MKEKIVDQLLDALVEDFSQEELNDLPSMKLYMKDTLGLSQDQMGPLLSGAIRIKLLRGDQPVLWQTIIKERFAKQ